MRIIDQTELAPAGVDETVFRASRAIFGLTALVMLVIGGVFGWWVVHGAPVVALAGFVVFVLVFIPVPIWAFVCTLSPDNWVLRIGPHGVTVRLRSWWVGGGGVVQLAWSEIELAGRAEEVVRERRGTGRRASRWVRRSLDLVVRAPGADGIGLALLEPEPKRQRRIGVRVRVRDTPVRWIEGEPGHGALRVTFGARNAATAPSLNAALDLCARHVTITDPIRLDPGRVRDLDDKAFEEHVIGLVDAGNTLAAVRAVHERTGCGTTEARRVVDGLGGVEPAFTER
jgi:hypothetical protein